MSISQVTFIARLTVNDGRDLNVDLAYSIASYGFFRLASVRNVLETSRLPCCTVSQKSKQTDYPPVGADVN